MGLTRKNEGMHNYMFRDNQLIRADYFLLKHNIIVLVGSCSERCLSLLSGKCRQTPEQC